MDYSRARTAGRTGVRRRKHLGLLLRWQLIDRTPALYTREDRMDCSRAPTEEQPGVRQVRDCPGILRLLCRLTRRTREQYMPEPTAGYSRPRMPERAGARRILG